MRMPPTSTMRVWGRSAAQVAPVGVAPDRVHRGDPLQGAQNLRVADVPGVDDEFHALQGLDRLGAQQAVGVGDDADAVLSHENPAGQGRPRRARLLQVAFCQSYALQLNEPGEP